MTDYPVIHEAKVLVADLHGDGGVITATNGLVFKLDYDMVDTYPASICERNATGKRAGLGSCHREPKRRLEMYRTIRDLGRNPDREDDRLILTFGSPFISSELKNLTPFETYEGFGCFSMKNNTGRAELVTKGDTCMLIAGLNRGDRITLVKLPEY